MYNKRVIIIINLFLLTLLQLTFLTQIIYAEEASHFNGYKPDLDFKKDYEYKLSEYDFLNEENKLFFNNFINNSACINQNGNQNKGSISQIRNFNSIVEIVQIGNKNKAEIKQYASYTKAEIFQFGNNHDLSIEQWGTKGRIYVIQSGNNFENKEIKILQL